MAALVQSRSEAQALPNDSRGIREWTRVSAAFADALDRQLSMLRRALLNEHESLLAAFATICSDDARAAELRAGRASSNNAGAAPTSQVQVENTRPEPPQAERPPVIIVDNGWCAARSSISSLSSLDSDVSNLDGALDRAKLAASVPNIVTTSPKGSILPKMLDLTPLVDLHSTPRPSEDQATSASDTIGIPPGGVDTSPRPPVKVGDVGAASTRKPLVGRSNTVPNILNGGVPNGQHSFQKAPVPSIASSVHATPCGSVDKERSPCERAISSQEPPQELEDLDEIPTYDAEPVQTNLSEDGVVSSMSIHSTSTMGDEPVLSKVVPAATDGSAHSMARDSTGSDARGEKSMPKRSQTLDLPLPVDLDSRSRQSSIVSVGRSALKRNPSQLSVNSFASERKAERPSFSSDMHELLCFHADDPYRDEARYDPISERSEEAWSNMPSQCQGKNSSDEHEEPAYHILPVWQMTRKRRSNYSNLNTHGIQAIHAKGILGQATWEEEGGLSQGAQVEMYWFMMHPGSAWQIMWNFIGLLLICYDCLSIPMGVFNPPETEMTLFFAWTSACVWTAHVGVSFATGYMLQNGSCELRPCMVARHYAVTWLPLDLLLATVDWIEVLHSSGDYLAVQLGDTIRAIRSVRVLRAMRMFRIFRARKSADFLRETLRSEKTLLLANIFSVMFMMFILVHIIACLYYWIGQGGEVDDEQASTESTWVSIRGLATESVDRRYFTSFHWSLSTFSGETLFMPENARELRFTCGILFVAFMVASYFVSSITTAMTRLQILSGEQASQVSRLRRYLADHGISRTLSMRVQRNAQFALAVHERNMSENSVELLKLISEPLREELHFEVHSVSLMRHPFFICYNEVNPMGLRKVCHMAVSAQSLTSGDVLFSVNEASRKFMFFLVNGRMTYEQGKTKRKVGKDKWSCEAPLWTTWWHLGTLKATTETQLLLLGGVKFQEICSTFPTDHAMIYARSFVQWLNEENRNSLSDIGELSPRMDAMLAEAFPIFRAAMEEAANEGYGVLQAPSLKRTNTSISNPTGMGKITLRRRCKLLLRCLSCYSVRTRVMAAIGDTTHEESTSRSSQNSDTLDRAPLRPLDEAFCVRVSRGVNNQRTSRVSTSSNIARSSSEIGRSNNAIAVAAGEAGPSPPPKTTTSSEEGGSRRTSASSAETDSSMPTRSNSQKMIKLAKQVRVLVTGT